MNALEFNNQIANLITGFIANIPTKAQTEKGLYLMTIIVILILKITQ